MTRPVEIVATAHPLLIEAVAVVLAFGILLLAAAIWSAG